MPNSAPSAGERHHDRRERQTDGARAGRAACADVTTRLDRTACVRFAFNHRIVSGRANAQLLGLDVAGLSLRCGLCGREGSIEELLEA